MKEYKDQRQQLGEKLRDGALAVEDAYEILGEVELRTLVRELALTDRTPAAGVDYLALLPGRSR
jgi:hypothetical protein